MPHNKDKFGDKLKALEMAYAGQKLGPGYICIRLDGKGFSKFTKGLKRPYDERLSGIMIDTMNHLLQAYHLDLGYTQSDEISFYIRKERESSESIYGRRIQKLTSIFASEATAFFNRKISQRIPEKDGVLAKFDCRVWTVETAKEVGDVFKWRMMDCIKNSISMAAHHHFGHKKTLNKNSDEKIDMLLSAGVNWSEYPEFFKFGTFSVKENVVLPIPEELKNFKSNIGKTTYIRSEIKNFYIEKHREVYQFIVDEDL